MSRSSTSTPASGERLDDRQERVGRERGRLVRVGVDDLHGGAHAIGIRRGMAFVPPARHLLARQGPRRRPVRRAARRRRHGRGGRPLARALQPRVPARRSASPRTRTCSPAGSSGPRRCCGSPTARVADICFSVGLQSVGSFTTSFTRTYGMSPTAYRASSRRPPTYAVVPGLRRARLRPPATQHVSRRQAPRPAISVGVNSNSIPRRTTMIRSPPRRCGCTTRTRRSPSTPRSSGWRSAPTSRWPSWATSAGSPSPLPARRTSRSS